MRVLFLHVLFLVVVFIAACARKSSVGRHQPTRFNTADGPVALVLDRASCQKGVAAFFQTVHPLLRNDCLPCHDVGGLSGKPHSVADVEKSYSRIIGYVNWGMIDESFFIKQGGNQHCLDHPGGHCKSTKEDIRKVIHDWWNMGQKECPNFGNYITRPETITQSAQTLKFSLSHLVSDVGPVVLQVEVKQEGSNYVLRKPRLSGHTTPVTISGLKILLNGTLQISANRWQLIQSSLLPETLEAPLLSVEEPQIPIISAGTDELSIGIDVLKAREPFTCQKMAVFEQSVMPTLARRSCYTCHGGGTQNAPGEPNAKQALDMAVPSATLCQKLLVRGGTQFPVDSPLIALPLRGRLNHPRAIALSSEILPSWVEWIRGENVR